MARQNVIVFSPRQWGELASHGNVDILIYDDSPEPLEIIPFTQLSKPPSYYKNYRLTLVDIATRRQTASSQRLREIRTASGLTITAFAKQLGVSFQSVSRWEKGILKPSHLASEKIKRFEKLQNIIFADKDNTEE